MSQDSNLGCMDWDLQLQASALSGIHLALCISITSMKYSRGYLLLGRVVYLYHVYVSCICAIYVYIYIHDKIEINERAKIRLVRLIRFMHTCIQSVYTLPMPIRSNGLPNILAAG